MFRRECRVERGVSVRDVFMAVFTGKGSMENKGLKILVSVCAGVFFAGFLCAAQKAENVAVGEIVKAEVKNKKIIITDQEGRLIDYTIKGICYAPDVNGDVFCENYEEDFPLIKKAGANSLRTYRPLGCHDDDGSGEGFNLKRSKKILDKCRHEHLTVTVGFSYEDMEEGGMMDKYLKEFGDHPAILMIAFGNEYNYHYGDWFTKEEWLQRLGEAAARARTYAPGKLIATVHGEMPSQQEYEEYVSAGMDIIMLNMYRGSNFGFTAQNWDKMSAEMPWVLGEFGRSSRSGDGNDTSKIQASNLQSLIRSMKHGYLFTLVDDPGKGDGELSSAIGREDSMGIYDENRKPKKALRTVQTEYGKISGAVYAD